MLNMFDTWHFLWVSVLDKLGSAIQYNTISFIADDKNKDREVSADRATTKTYYMMGIIKI